MLLDLAEKIRAFERRYSRHEGKDQQETHCSSASLRCQPVKLGRGPLPH
jgi:hypothetical protein